MATRRTGAPAKKPKSLRHRRAHPGRKAPVRQVVARLSSDWYWEQDAALRFVRIQGHAGTRAEQHLVDLNLGKCPWETGVSVEGGWEAHRALLASRASFREVLMWRDFDDGSRRYISVSGEPVFDTKGRFAGYRGVGRDITRQKRGEQLLHLQHAVTRSLAEAAGPVDVAQAALRAICESEGWDCGELWRIDEAGAAMRRFADWIAPGARGRYAQIAVDYVFHRGEGLVGTAWQSGKPIWVPDATVDARVVRRSRVGQTGVHAVLLCPLHSEGQVTGVLDFMCRKIRPPDDALLDAINSIATQLGLFLQRAEAQARLGASEERFRRTFELAGSGVAHVGMDGRLLRVNRRVCEMFGYAERELVGRSVKDLSHPEDRDVTDTERARMHRGEIHLTRFQKRYVRKDGSTLWVEMAVTVERDAAGTPLYEITVMDDIGARKAAELAVQESEARFRRTFELAGVGVAHIGPDRRFQRVNRRFCEILGYPEEELVGRTGRELSHPDDLDHMNAQRPRLYAGEIDAARGEKRYLRKDGTVVWVAYTLAIERDAAGNPLYEIAVYDDVSARKRAEQLLRLEHQVATTLSEARSSIAGVTAVMRLLCEAEGWACGRAFRVDEATQRLVYRRGWTAPGSPFGKFLEASRDLWYAPGQGLAGIVWLTGEPLWSADTTRDPRAKAKSLSLEGARGAFLLPAKVEGHVLGVLAFTSREVREPDERLLQASRVIGAQVGQFLQRMRAEEALRESEARFRALTEMSSDFFWETDAGHRLTDLTYGQGAVGRPGEALGKVPWDIASTHPDEAGWAALRAKVDARQRFRDFEFGRPQRDGGVRYFSVSGEPRFASDGGFIGYRGVGRDITDLVLARERIASLAYHDPLTGLANRTSLAPALEQAVERTRRRGSKLAGVFLDLDGFKHINDLYGHDAGDLMLVEVAQRLRAALRSSDPVARLGGDEFFVVLEDLQNNAPAERVANKLLAALLEPYDVGDGRQARISASIGISLFPDDAGDAATLIKHADTAMYAVKQAGKNAYRFFAARPAANDGRTSSAEEAV